MSEIATTTPATEIDNLPAAFERTGAMDAMLAAIAADARSHAPDVSTDRGRKAIASVAYRVAQSKSALDKAGLALTEGMRETIAAVNAERTRAKDFLDDLRVEVRKPLTDWETAEDERKASLRQRLGAIRRDAPEDAAGIAAEIGRVEAIAVGDDWDEFRVDAASAVRSELDRLHGLHVAASLREAQERELAELRAEKLRRDAEDRARAEKETAERLAQKLAEEERQAALRAEAEKERAAQVEREREARATIELQEAEQRAATKAREEAEAAAQAAIIEANRRAREAEDAAERAAQAERDRIAAAARREHEAAERRAADQAHRDRIRAQIEAALKGVLAEAGTGLLPHAQVAEALLAGRIPHVEVRL